MFLSVRQRFSNFCQMNNDFLSSPFLCFLKTIIAISISEVRRRWESLGSTQHLSTILCRFISTWGNAILVGEAQGSARQTLKSSNPKGSLRSQHILKKMVSTSLASHSFVTSNASCACPFRLGLCPNLASSGGDQVLSLSSCQKPHQLRLTARHQP